MTNSKKIIAAVSGIAALGIVSAGASTPASAKPFHHHHWHGGPVLVVADAYPTDCYLVKRFDRKGRPFFVNVCD